MRKQCEKPVDKQFKIKENTWEIDEGETYFDVIKEAG